MSNHTDVTGVSDSSVSFMGPHYRDETKLEYISDFILGLAFVLVGVAAAQR